MSHMSPQSFVTLYKSFSIRQLAHSSNPYFLVFPERGGIASAVVKLGGASVGMVCFQISFDAERSTSHMTKIAMTCRRLFEPCGAACRSRGPWCERAVPPYLHNARLGQVLIEIRFELVMAGHVVLLAAFLVQ